MNYCFTHAGKFSCAVDYFLELTFAVFKDSLNCIERNEFFQKLSEACFQLENYDLQTDMTLIREPIWAHLRERCNSFASMSANAVFSDIFRLNTVGSLLGLSRVTSLRIVSVGGQVYSSYKELHHIIPSCQRQSFSAGKIPAEQRLHFHTVSYLTKSSLSQQPFNARNIVTQFLSKINRQFCRQMTRILRE